MFLSEVLWGERVGLLPEDDHWLTIYFAQVPIARFDSEKLRVTPLPETGGCGEIKVVGAWPGREGNRTVIFVTTKAHTRRVGLLWRRLAPGQSRAIVRAASGDSFDPGTGGAPRAMLSM